VGGGYASYAANATCENLPPGVGAGGWAMSAVDLLRWFTSIDGKPGSVPELLNAKNQTFLTTAGTPKTPRSPPYASGMYVNGSWDFCGTPVAMTQGHNGGLFGASSELWLFPDGFAIAVILNQDTANAGACPNNGGPARTTVKNLLGVVRKIGWPETDQF
jgi:hypothetical protein